MSLGIRENKRAKTNIYLLLSLNYHKFSLVPLENVTSLSLVLSDEQYETSPNIDSLTTRWKKQKYLTNRDLKVVFPIMDRR